MRTRPFIVGKEGPELFTPLKPGNVIPMHMPESEHPTPPLACDDCGREIEANENVTGVMNADGAKFYCTDCR